MIDGPIKVFLMPHSHDDVGWLKTVDDYFYGADQSTQWAGVQYTIDTVVSELANDPTYKFSIVETAFLYRWWNNANQTQRDLIKRHVKSGQIEFINAGWCMSDEANPYYEDIIDQMTIGFRWIKDTFGVVPTIGWHIDPFGHQATNAALFSQFGFNAWFFARIDQQDKSVRMANKGLEMIWHPTQYSGIDNYIFTHVNYYHYSPPPGFCFDNNCRDEPIRDDPTLDNYNLVAKSEKLVEYFKNQSLHYRSSNLFHTLGEDFHYANARMWYKNVDKLLNYINARPELNVTINYATPGEYLKAINQESNVYPTKYDDFFPYSDCDHCYWTGYFTSRTSLKGFIRDMGRYVTSVRTHLGLLKVAGSSDYIKANTKETEEALWEAEMALGILQHHDAVAGTAKQKVTNNYILTGCKALAILNKHYNEVRKEQIKNDISETVATINLGTIWNGTAADWGISAVLATNKSVLVSLYNPGPKGTYTIRLKVEEQELNIISSAGTTVAGDLICSNTQDTKDCDVLFNLAFEETSTSYVKLVPVKSGGSAKITKLKSITITESTRDFNLSSTASLKYTRSLQKFDLTTSNGNLSFTVGYNYYESYQSDGQKSGAYIFRPANDTILTPKKYSDIKTVHYAEGEVNTIIVLEGDKTYTRMYFSKLAKYVDQNGFEMETLISPINISDRIGKEIVLNLATTLQNNKTFYTDSNGLEEQKRVVDYRPTWPLVQFEPASGNYYPVNSHISIIDVNTKQRVSVLVDRSQGGTVLRDGSLEIMIQRRTTMDDSRGVGEPLDENGISQKVRHFVVIGDGNRAVQKANDQRIITCWANTASATFAKHPAPKPALPVQDTVKLYLRPFADDSYLLRLMNFDTSKSVNRQLIADYRQHPCWLDHH